MNVVVVPDAAMIVIPLIEKNGHTYLSPSSFSKYDNNDICEGNLSFDNLISKYSTDEIPSGVKSRLFLFSKVINKADAAIILGKRPGNSSGMYGALNELILFGSSSCNNAKILEIKIIEDFKIPTLKLAYPTTQKQIIDLIKRTDYFLKNLDEIDSSVNEDNLGVDLTPKRDTFSVAHLSKILDNLI
ncbi:DUF2112 family protein [Methanobrevibacter sp.]|uniref:DUF2112 family protein n=1 Tax=Methanobrevibacter sp. TaxID=66852 RepID=UPI0026E04804|nr:DUF2112 family protein [Methanobrevibacter sp.]MDO5859365.1 DUF2112 family protein [Methanobrevibacter sp.]